MLWLIGPSIATHTAPTGWPSNGFGPATPVVPIAQVVPKDLIAPFAIATATSSLMTVYLSISSGSIPK